MERHSHPPPPRSHVAWRCSCKGERELVERLAVDKAQSSSRVTCIPACKKKFDWVALSVVSGITTAFFTSLERCSCIHLGTKDESDDPSLSPLIVDQGRRRQDVDAADGKKFKVEGPSRTTIVDIKQEQLQ